MFSFRNAFRDIANWVNGVDDYVVEQGTSGIWTYRKWKSGVAECYGLTPIINSGTLTKSQSIYYSKTLDIATIPSFIKNVTHLNGTMTVPHSVAWLSQLNYEGTKVNCIVDREQSSTFSFKVYITLIGTLGGVTNLLKVLWRWSYA